MKKKVAIYTRVSTKDQSVDMQVSDLTEYAKVRKFDVVSVYRDEGVSGSKARRPALDKLMEAARRRKFDIVLVWKFDRFGRSVVHLINSMMEFNNLGIDFISFTQGIDTTVPLGKLIFNICAAFSEFELEDMSMKIKAGLKEAKKKGIHIGREPVPEHIKEKIRSLREQEGLSYRVLATRFDLGKSVIGDIVNEGGGG